jgi:hypothetical protein
VKKTTSDTQSNKGTLSIRSVSAVGLLMLLVGSATAILV